MRANVLVLKTIQEIVAKITLHRIHVPKWNARTMEPAMRENAHVLKTTLEIDVRSTLLPIHAQESDAIMGDIVALVLANVRKTGEDLLAKPPTCAGIICGHIMSMRGTDRLMTATVAFKLQKTNASLPLIAVRSHHKVMLVVDVIA